MGIFDAITRIKLGIPKEAEAVKAFNEAWDTWWNHNARIAYGMETSASDAIFSQSSGAPKLFFTRITPELFEPTAKAELLANIDAQIKATGELVGSAEQSVGRQRLVEDKLKSIFTAMFGKKSGEAYYQRFAHYVSENEQVHHTSASTLKPILFGDEVSPLIDARADKLCTKLCNVLTTSADTNPIFMSSRNSLHLAKVALTPVDMESVRGFSAQHQTALAAAKEYLLKNEIMPIEHEGRALGDIAGLIGVDHTKAVTVRGAESLSHAASK